MQVAAKPVQVVVVEAEEEEEAGSPVTWIAYTLALAWLISYACFLWVESLPTQLPCAWGIHGCAPHSQTPVAPPALLRTPFKQRIGTLDCKQVSGWYSLITSPRGLLPSPWADPMNGAGCACRRRTGRRSCCP
jgi:hypothetical protein